MSCQACNSVRYIGMKRFRLRAQGGSAGLLNELTTRASHTKSLDAVHTNGPQRSSSAQAASGGSVPNQAVIALNLSVVRTGSFQRRQQRGGRQQGGRGLARERAHARHGPAQQVRQLPPTAVPLRLAAPRQAYDKHAHMSRC